MQARLDMIAKLSKGWNNDRADPIDKQDIELVREVLDYVTAAGLAEPIVCPSPEGGIDLEWSEPSFELHISCEDMFVQYGAPSFSNQVIEFPSTNNKVIFAIYIINKLLSQEPLD